MCGIAGSLDLSRRRSRDELAGIADRMGGALHHRGPDAGGRWLSPEDGIALGHRRLAVVDLTETGGQPMVSSDGRFVLVYNGELYNASALRQRLLGEGARFRGTSDTEVLLEAVARWGLEAAIREANGMFALALWDVRDRSLTLVRDRMGEKPLYYGWFGTEFLFASELRALEGHPAFVREVDPAAVSAFLHRGYVPEPRSILKGVRKLPPGAALCVSAEARTPNGQLLTLWSARAAAVAGASDPFREHELPDALDQLDALLVDAVRGRLIADVPVGVLLSGGVDSSLVALLAAEVSNAAIHTFTVGFPGTDFDESPQASAFAGAHGFEHTQLLLSDDDIRSAAARMSRVYDEPFADSSQIPTLLVAELARRDVVVALGGDGGDELFAGYARHLWAARRERLERLPRPVRRAAAAGLAAVPPQFWDSAAGMLPARRRPARSGAKAGKLAALLAAEPAEAYSRTLAVWLRPDDVLSLPGGAPHDVFPEAAGLDALSAAQLRDQVDYLPGDLLVKVDRAAMSVSLETRLPLLDHRIVETSWRFPPAWRMRDGHGKWPLRQLLGRRQADLARPRPKRGFGVPLDGWLRGPLREWAGELLEPDRLAAHGLFRSDVVSRLWQEQQQGSRHAQQLWTVLMFQAWSGEVQR